MKCTWCGKPSIDPKCLECNYHSDRWRNVIIGIGLIIIVVIMVVM
jgi:primosomal protein N'